MKTKIMNALKTEYANLGLGDKAFDGVASFLVKTVTEEGQIADAIKEEGVKALLKSIQGESDHLRNRATQLQKDLDDYKKLHPETDDPTKKTPEDDPNKALLDKLTALEEKFNAQEKAEKQKAVIASVIASVKQNGCTDEKGLDLTQRLFSLKDNESDEDAAARFKAEYDATMKKYFGDGVLPHHGNTLHSPVEVSAADKAAKAREDAKRVREG